MAGTGSDTSAWQWAFRREVYGQTMEIIGPFLKHHGASWCWKGEEMLRRWSILLTVSLLESERRWLELAPASP